MKITFRLLSLCALIAVLSANAFAITWFPKEFTCPIDNQKNTFLVVGSYGSYIYSYPSKYQWLFFPQTDSPTYYICKKCHLTTYMWDFDKLPKDKLPEIKKILASVKISKAFKEYTELPVSERLEIMEKIYPVLNKDGEWWETFYRVKGYHYAKEGKTEKASEARRKSLAMIEKDLTDEKSENPKKIMLYISGAMKHFLGNDTGALADLQKALTTKYQEKDAKPEEIQQAEENLNERIEEYIAKIKSEKQKPRLFDRTDEGH
jgi:hypothetical protein